MRAHTLFLVVIAAAFSVLADIQITTPTATTHWVGGSTVEMSWKSSKDPPALSEFSTFTVYLCWGSNEVPMCDQILGPASAKFSVSSTTTKFLIPAAVGGSGSVYFVKMETAATNGGFTWNYSPRFTLTGMTGTFSTAALLEQRKQDTTPPPRKDTTLEAVAPKDGGERLAKVPYTLQTGATRYAPMQTQPGSRITAGSWSRRYPTSSYSLFTDKGPRPNAQTTITQVGMRHSVTSRVNSASPASMDKDMRKFLKRWKD